MPKLTAQEQTLVDHVLAEVRKIVHEERSPVLAEVRKIVREELDAKPLEPETSAVSAAESKPEPKKSFFTKKS